MPHTDLISSDPSLRNTVESDILSLSAILAEKVFSPKRRALYATIFSGRYGCGPYAKDRTLAELGAHDGVTRQRVSQALLNMRSVLKTEIDPNVYRPNFDRALAAVAPGMSLDQRDPEDDLSSWLGPTLTLRHAQWFYADCFGWSLRLDRGRVSREASYKKDISSRWMLPISHEDEVFIRRAFRSMQENTGAVEATRIVRHAQQIHGRSFDLDLVKFLLERQQGLAPVSGHLDWYCGGAPQRNHFLTISEKVLRAVSRPVPLETLQWAAFMANRNAPRVRSQKSIKLVLPPEIAQSLLLSAGFTSSPQGWSPPPTPSRSLYTFTEMALLETAKPHGPLLTKDLIARVSLHSGVQEGAAAMSIFYSGLFRSIGKYRVLTGSEQDTEPHLLPDPGSRENHKDSQNLAKTIPDGAISEVT